jgi:nucleoside-diphosphate-sugar epimerase
MAQNAILVTGAAGNLGAHLLRHLLTTTDIPLRAMIHGKNLPSDLCASDRLSVFKCDLGKPETLSAACDGTKCIVHFAGKLFSPHPEKFLPHTNVVYLRNLVEAAQRAGVESAAFAFSSGGRLRRALGKHDGIGGAANITQMA